MLIFENRPDELFALFRREKKDNAKLAIFVHGFFGNYLSTWGALPDLLYKHAAAEQPFSEWDYVFLGFSTPSIKGYLDISDLIANHVRAALKGDRPYSHEYTEVSLLGHSLGTLGIRQFLCTNAFYDADLISRVQSVTLFGTPGKGSPLAPLAAPFVEVGHALKPGNPQLRMLREWTYCAYQSAKWPAPRVVMGKGDMVVGSEFVAFAGDNENVVASNFGHFALVKPNSWRNSQVIDIIASALT